MPKISYVARDGAITEIEAKAGESVMHAAVANDVDGIIGECGGSMMCATCHCYIDEEWMAVVGTGSVDEHAMLDCAASDVKPTSRLSCQIKLTADMDGLVVHLPESQL